MALKGRIKQQNLISWDEVLDATNRGYDVFRADIGKINNTKPFQHPLRKDIRPSGGLTYAKDKDVWVLKDLGGVLRDMTALQYTMNKYNLDGREAINKMAQDFGLIQSDNKIHTPIVKDWESPKIKEAPIHINMSSKPFQKEHNKFWEGTEVTEAHCNKYNTWAVKDLVINRKRVFIRPNEVVFAYEANGRFKIYFPDRPKDERFKNNVPGDWLWHLDKIDKCKNLLVQKSMKDLLVSTVLMKDVTATQNESAKIFTEEVANRLESMADEVFIAYGSDAQGVEQSTLITEEHNWGWVNPKAELLPDINDTYSLVKKFGMKAWEDLLKYKNIL
jgi:hypothetical protein